MTNATNDGCGGSSEGTCNDCIPGEFIDAWQAKCAQCPAGKFSSDTNAPECTECPAGQYQTLQAKQFCDLCPIGKYQSTANSTACNDCTAGQSSGSGEEGCAPCPAGTAAAEAGSECAECAGGKYQNIKGKPTCKQCPVCAVTKAANDGLSLIHI